MIALRGTTTNAKLLADEPSGAGSTNLGGALRAGVTADVGASTRDQAAFQNGQVASTATSEPKVLVDLPGRAAADSHGAVRALVVGYGPNLARSDPSVLDGELTFASAPDVED